MTSQKVLAARMTRLTRKIDLASKTIAALPSQPTHKDIGHIQRQLRELSEARKQLDELATDAG